MMVLLKVSSGNILLVDRGGELVGVLMDFEYAKDVNAEGSAHEFRIVSVLYHQSLGSLIKSPRSQGTMQFMAVEAYGQKNFLTSKTEENFVLGADWQEIESMVVFSPRPLSVRPWRHNIIHDVESVWWLCTWVVHYFMHAELPVVDHVERQKFRELFPVYGEEVNPRMMAFIQPDLYIDSYQPSTCPDNVHRTVGAWRNVLAGTYRSLHSENLAEDPHAYALKMGIGAARRIGLMIKEGEELSGRKKIKSRFSNCTYPVD